MGLMYSPQRHPLVQPEQPAGRTDMDYHVKEWISGSQGGGHVPDDFEWNSNPKQYQEENGSSAPTHAPPKPAPTEPKKP